MPYGSQQKREGDGSRCMLTDGDEVGDVKAGALCNKNRHARVKVEQENENNGGCVHQFY